MSDANRLISEKSPYLLQHAYNPVDWYAWGDDAFNAAREQDKPIFLSIGYSTCHWCHVMERESFENEAIARLMNDTFVSIKVDREERPDIDHLYMSVCQMMRERCGWPLNIVMTPDARPFFATTYVPPSTRFQVVGMDELIPRLKQAWLDKREEIDSSARHIHELIKQAAGAESGQTGDLGFDISPKLLLDATARLNEEFDSEYGGFGSAPKFPMAHHLLFLMQQWSRSPGQNIVDMVNKTLASMARGGMYDHVGFGFHRYSTDREWFLPHFEKMLYDQALLLMAYVKAAQILPEAGFDRIAREIGKFVCTELRGETGAFYSAIDADSEGIEGKFYVWTTTELETVLTSNESEFVRARFGLRDEGNFEEEAPTGQLDGANIFHIKRELSEMSLAERAVWDPIRQKLYSHRSERIHPFLDDKILADWNGLMIAALAQSSILSGAQDNLSHAVVAAEFVFTEMYADGRLFRRWKDGEAAIAGTATDYVFMAHAAIELYLHTFDEKWLDRSLELHAILTTRFFDEEKGGYFITASDSESLLVRQKDWHDGAIPSANSVGFTNLIRLAHITGDDLLMEQARMILSCVSERVTSYPTAFTWLLSGLDHLLGPAVQVVIVGKPDAPDTVRMHKELRSLYAPHIVGVFVSTVSESDRISELAAYTKSMKSIGGKATAYVCVNHVCALPTSDVSEMRKLIHESILSG
ncbi:MAG: thioredoxin domain-containing protein [Bacteroidetes bacterium]|nr:MAG: thioredoxin domain-containing protein [Bacteroidota bacterium]